MHMHVETHSCVLSNSLMQIPAQAEDDIQDIIKNLLDDQARPADALGYYRFKVESQKMGLELHTCQLSHQTYFQHQRLLWQWLLSPSTGILLNNDMEGFSLGDDSSNSIKRFPLTVLSHTSDHCRAPLNSCGVSVRALDLVCVQDEPSRTLYNCMQVISHERSPLLCAASRYCKAGLASIRKQL